MVLDTHAWFWWEVEPARLSIAAQRAIDSADAIGVSSVSCWELAMLTEHGRVSLDRPVSQWVQIALATSELGRLPSARKPPCKLPSCR